MWHYAAYLSDGKVLGSSPLKSPPKGGEGFKFKHLNIERKEISFYPTRVSKLRFLLKVFSEYGLSDKAYKSLKRLNLVAFTCHIKDFCKLVQKTARDCGYRWRKTRNQVPCTKHRGKHPSFTEETRSIDSLNGHQVRLWTWVPDYHREDSWDESQD